MIPARGDYEAVYSSTINGRTIEQARPVEAFSDSGAALVVTSQGWLQPADSLGGFVRVDRSAQRVAGVVPGGGWKVAFTDTDGGHQWIEDVVAWVVNSVGNATPLTLQDEGSPMAMEVTDDNVRMIPPGGDQAAGPTGDAPAAEQVS